MINILKMIEREMKLKHMTKADLSRRMELHYSTVHGMLSRNTIQVHKLNDLCEIFSYNFFEEISEGISSTDTNFEHNFSQTKAELSAEIIRLKEENKSLNAKIEVLKEVIGKNL